MTGLPRGALDPVAVLAGMLGLHLVVHTLHGVPHQTIPVRLDTAVTAAVLFVAYVLPVAGGLLLWRGADRAGIATITVGLGLSLAISTLLHYVLAGPDNVAAIPTGRWQAPFHLTAGLITVVDALGVAAGAWTWQATQGANSDALPDSGRIDGVPAAGVRPFTRLTYWLSGRMVGEVPEPLTVTAHHPPLLAATGADETALQYADEVDATLTDLVVLKTAMVAGCEFCLDIGTAQARTHAVTEAQLRDLHRVESSDAFSERERLALRYAVAMTETPVDVPDALFEDLREAFDEAALVELTATIAFENYRARFNHALDIDAQGFSDGAACPRPNPLGADRGVVDTPGPNEAA